jgi:hypothetical protein
MEVMKERTKQRKFAVGIMETNDRVRLTQSLLIEMQKSTKKPQFRVKLGHKSMDGIFIYTSSTKTLYQWELENRFCQYRRDLGILIKI